MGDRSMAIRSLEDRERWLDETMLGSVGKLEDRDDLLLGAAVLGGIFHSDFAMIGSVNL
ncbi:MAG: hypothetical protein PVS2B2_06730 [Candidatus Acidiferrum sp.]